MKLIVLLAILIVLAFAAYCVVKAAQSALNKNSEWKVSREFNGPYEEVWLTNARANPVFIDRVRINSEDYGSRIMEIVAQAEDEMYEKNSVQKALKR